ncbi:MAG: hypothetical protein H7067_03460, partial [Burkholderiales bacterium]|nr:hypothetical protein [Opitutaceae bacterium]
MPLDPQTLDKLLRAGDTDRIVAFFSGAPETERNALAGQATLWQRLLETNQKSYYLNDNALKKLRAFEVVADPRQYGPGAYAALVACAGLTTLRTIRHPDITENHLVEILADRRPPWIQDYAESLLDVELHTWSFHGWWLVRALVKARLCGTPVHDNYALGALPALGSRLLPAKRVTPDGKIEDNPPSPLLADVIAGEGDWLAGAFWRLFEVDGTSEVSLANLEKYTRARGGWSEALAELSHRDLVPRARLLDASLDALSRDFVQFRAGWFSRFHEALAPTPTERLERLEAYINLLASAIPPTVAFALEAVALIDRENPLPSSRLLPAVAPVLHARTKGAALLTLGLLDRLAARETTARAEVCISAVAGLLHEAIDVQKAVFSLIEKHADPRDPALRARLAEMTDAVAASLRKRLAPWIDAAPPPGPARAQTKIQPVAERISCLDTSRAIPAVDSLDDLLALAGKVLAAPGDAHDLERLLDGLSRLCDLRPEDFARHSGPLRKQAWKKWSAAGARLATLPSSATDVARLLLAWIDGQDPCSDARSPAIDAAAPASRAQALWSGLLNDLTARVVRRAARPLLSAPTHRGGWIEPATLVARWQACDTRGESPSPAERVLALQRLALDGRESALSAASAMKGKHADVLRSALAKTGKTDTAPAPPRWRPFVETRTIQGRTYCYFRIAWLTDDQKSAEPETVDHADCHTFETDDPALLRWWALSNPADLEPLFAEAVGRLSFAMDYSEVDDRETALLLEPLAEPGCELRETARLALALGLAACG